MKINIFRELEKNKMYLKTFSPKPPPMPDEVQSWPYHLQEMWCWLAEPSSEQADRGLHPYDELATEQVKKSEAYKKWKKTSENAEN